MNVHAQPRHERIAQQVPHDGWMFSRRAIRMRRWTPYVLDGVVLVAILLWGREGLLVIAAEIAIVAAVSFATIARPDDARTQALLEFVMPPVVRRLLRAELEVLLTPIRALLRAAGALRSATEISYRRLSKHLASSLAWLAGALAEIVIVEILLVPDDWVALRIGLAVLSAYGIVAVVGYGLGHREFPHAVRGDDLVLRLGQLYRVRVTFSDIAAVRVHEQRLPGRARDRLADLGEQQIALAVGGRTNLELELRRPVSVERVLKRPLQARTLAIGADDPDAARALLCARMGVDRDAS